MGWKRTLRSLESTGKQAQREMEKADRKLDRNVEQVKQQIRKLDEQMQKDIIDAFGLRYSENSGLQSEPVELQTEVFSGSLEFPTMSAEEAAEYPPEPDIYQVNGAFVEPLAFIVSPWCSLLPLKVGHSDPDYRIRFDWVKARKKKESRVYVVDSENSEYYYPTSTDLKGEVVADRPRTGLIAFEPFRAPTDSVEIHFSDVKLLGKRGAREMFFFEYSDPDLAQSIERHLHQPSIAEQVLEQVEDEEARVRRKLKNSGCSVVLLLLAGTLTVLLSSAAVAL